MAACLNDACKGPSLETSPPSATLSHQILEEEKRPGSVSGISGAVFFKVVRRGVLDPAAPLLPDLLKVFLLRGGAGREFLHERLSPTRLRRGVCGADAGRVRTRVAALVPRRRANSRSRIRAALPGWRSSSLASSSSAPELP